MKNKTVEVILSKFRSIISICIIAFALLCYFNSCEPDTSIEELKTAETYFPLAIGKYIVYSVDSIRYHEVAPTDTSYYEIKEILVDTFYDNESRLNYKIERFARSSDTADWVLVNVWNVLYTDNQLQKIENNLRFIKLVAPLRNDISWEGNIYLGGLEDIPVDEDCNLMPKCRAWIVERSDEERGDAGNLGVDRQQGIKSKSFPRGIRHRVQEEWYGSEGIGTHRPDREVGRIPERFVFGGGRQGDQLRDRRRRRRAERTKRFHGSPVR